MVDVEQVANTPVIGSHWEGRVPLSNREEQILRLVADGHAMKEIAVLLKLSIKTVEAHKRSVMTKLQLFTIAQLTKFALLEGLTSPEP